MFDSRLSSASTSVVLPAPEGATTTKRLPEFFALLNVLDLFAHLFDEDLQLHRDARDLVRDGFRSQGVRLAVELLAEEVEPLAASTSLVEHTAIFRDVRDEARKLLVHVDARAGELRDGFADER